MKINKLITKINRTKANRKTFKFIVVHWVGAVSSAKANCQFFYSKYRGASAHLFVDDTSIWQCVELKDIAWHCGGGLQGPKGHKYHKICTNSNSIGIEMCCYNKNGKLDISDKTINNTIALVKELMKKYNIPADRVIRHFDVTGKNCPGVMVSNEKRWKEFKAKLVTTPKKEEKKDTKKGYTGTFPVLGKKGYLSKGDKGIQVARLQNFLNWCIGAKLSVDQDFGNKTLKAVKSFQKKYGLEVDGYFGKGSLAKAKTIKK